MRSKTRRTHLSKIRMIDQLYWYRRQCWFNYYNKNTGEMTEMAEGARLEIVCTPKSVPRVRIPLSPPVAVYKPQSGVIAGS